LRVDETAGCLDWAENISMERTHFNMNKFGHPEEEEYQNVLDEIMKMMAPEPSPPSQFL